MASGTDTPDSLGGTDVLAKPDLGMDSSGSNRGSVAEASSPWQDLHARLESSLQRLRDNQVGSRGSLQRPLREPLLGPAGEQTDLADSRYTSRRADAGQARLSTSSAASFLSSPEVQHYATAVNSARESMLSCSSARTAASDAQGNAQQVAETSARSSSPHSAASNQSEGGLNAVLFSTYMAGGDGSTSPRAEADRPPSPGRTLCCRRRYDGGVAELESNRPSALSLGAMRRLPLQKEPDSTVEVSALLPTAAPEPAGTSTEPGDSTHAKCAARVVEHTETPVQMQPKEPQPADGTKGLGQWLRNLGWRRNGASSAEESTSVGALDIVHFAAPHFFADESSRVACIEVMRIGSLKGSCSVSYSTCQATQAEARYAATTGKVSFLEGETFKKVQAALIPDNHWATTAEMQVRLHNPQNCELDEYLCRSVVKVMDVAGNTFPAARYREKVGRRGHGGIDDIRSLPFIWHYMWLNFMTAPGVHWRTLLVLVLDQLKSLYVYLRLFLAIYIIDTLLNTTEERAKDALLIDQGPADGRVWTAAALGGLYFAPILILMLWERAKAQMRLLTLCKEFLQVNLMRRFLDYDKNSLEMVSVEVLEAAMVGDIDKVSRAYAAAMVAVKHSGAVIAILCFIIVENPAAIGLYVVLMSLVLAASAVIVAMQRRGLRSAGKVPAMLRKTHSTRSLIRGYGQCVRTCRTFQEACQADEACASLLEREVQSVRWVGHLLAAGFTCIYGILNLTAALTDAISMGAFVVTLLASHALCEELVGLVEQLRNISAAAGPLKDLAWLLNLPTDLAVAREAALARSDHSQAGRAAAAEKRGKLGELLPEHEDPMAIQLSAITLANPWIEGALLCQDVNSAVAQGKLVAVVGQTSANAALLLRIIGQDVVPDSGRVLVPSHLRVLHLSSEPVYFDGSCWDNVTFGRPEAEPDFVLSLLRRLEMGRAIEYVENELRLRQTDSKGAAHRCSAESKASTAYVESCTGWKAMSTCDQVKLQLARAFVMNPEVLVLHGHFAQFGESFCQTVVEVLKEFVRHRGVAHSEKSMNCRRPRTCFFSPEMMAQAEAADIVWYLGSNTASVQSFQGSEFAANTSIRMELLKAC